MPTLTIPNTFLPNTKILSADVNDNFTAISTLLNTTGLNDSNIQNDGINPLTKLSTATGSANQFLKVVGSDFAFSDEKTQGYEISNLGVSAGVSSSTLVINLLQANATTATTSSPVRISFRSGVGQFTTRTVTGATSLTISAGSTLGTVSGRTDSLWLYAIDNAGTVELAISGVLYAEGAVVNTTAEGGGGGADLKRIIYSTSARTGVAIRLICQLSSTQTTAGTWGTAPGITAINPGQTYMWDPVTAIYYGSSVQVAGSGATTVMDFNNRVVDTHNVVTTGVAWEFNTPYTGVYNVSAKWKNNAGVASRPTMTLEVSLNGTLARYLDQRDIKDYTADTGTISLSGTALILATAGDSMQIRIYKDSAGALTGETSAPQCYVCIHRVS